MILSVGVIGRNRQTLYLAPVKLNAEAGALRNMYVTLFIDADKLLGSYFKVLVGVVHLKVGAVGAGAHHVYGCCLGDDIAPGLDFALHVVCLRQSHDLQHGSEAAAVGNVDTKVGVSVLLAVVIDIHILCYDIRDLGKQLLPVGMLVVLDSIFNRIIRNRGLKRNTWIYIDEIYLLFQHEYSANFLFTLWKRMRKYQACGTGISQNIEDLLQSHTARTMLANSEFLIMLNQAATDREELAHLLNISDNQLSYITNVDSGRGLIKCGSAIVPFVDHFPKNKLYRLMTTKPSDLAA